VGSSKPLITIKFMELDTPNSSFSFKDGREAWIRYKDRQKHGRLSVDGTQDPSAAVQLLLPDKTQRFKSADLPPRFPITTDESLFGGLSVSVGNWTMTIRLRSMVQKPDR
jgi:hypothetical protein